MRQKIGENLGCILIGPVMQDRLEHVDISLGVLRVEKVVGLEGDSGLQGLGDSLVELYLDLWEILNDNFLQVGECLAQAECVVATRAADLMILAPNINRRC